MPIYAALAIPCCLGLDAWFSTHLTMPTRLGRDLVLVIAAIGVGWLSYLEFLLTPFSADPIVEPDLAAEVAAAPPAQPLLLWSGPTIDYFLLDRTPMLGFATPFSLMLPGYTSAAAMADVCRDVVAQRPVIVSDGGDLPLSADQPLRSATAQAWIAPLEAVVAAGYDVDTTKAGYHVYVPRLDVPLWASMCTVDGPSAP